MDAAVKRRSCNIQQVIPRRTVRPQQQAELQQAEQQQQQQKKQSADSPQRDLASNMVRPTDLVRPRGGVSDEVYENVIAEI